MKALSKLYTANVNNEVVLFSTNLKEFAEALIALEPNADTYFTYRRKFEKTSLLPFTGKSGKKYLLQEVYNAKKSVGQEANTGLSSTNPK
ncbi:MAG: hypothetical protein CFE23_16360 [Flavobacterium sp. BFFFF1]|uniref:hypothetical protein n=1 Tax=Flavobacterium sp. BFFFF1 TaxID=2015557 RepID=UPI000BCA0277|nr:hypothetical protein [Flavobacterium sp. BFFFF1]OYU78943.1 MAG: hypothetical protein CFE23_16360 [Flavobacterium sp. BFFFF1]